MIFESTKSHGHDLHHSKQISVSTHIVHTLYSSSSKGSRTVKPLFTPALIIVILIIQEAYMGTSEWINLFMSEWCRMVPNTSLTHFKNASRSDMESHPNYSVSE